MHVHPFELSLPDRDPVAAILLRPDEARAAYVFGHGAGAGMQHAFMRSLAERLAARGIATLRYQFPYMEAGRRRPDGRNVLLATVRAAIAAAAHEAPDLPIFAGGKSMGGRMTSHAAADDSLPNVRGLIFVGFPLHPPKRPGTDRAAHLRDVDVPMLFLQGTRDDLADLDLIRGVTDGLSLATLHVVDGANHGFHVLKRSGRTDEEVLDELATTTRDWIADRR